MPTVGIRITDAQKIELEERSAHFSGNVSEYVKGVLFGPGHSDAQEILARLDELSAQVVRVQARSTGREHAQRADLATMMLSELLILTRMSMSPDKMRAARGELDRLEIETWVPSLKGKTLY